MNPFGSMMNVGKLAGSDKNAPKVTKNGVKFQNNLMNAVT